MTRRRLAISRRGMTLVEAVLSMVIVSVLLVSALNATGSVWRGRQITDNHARGLPLAEDLMAEILAHPYTDPDLPDWTVIEIDSGDGNSQTRSNYDDVDDYDSWIASPPEDINGNALAGFDGWTRSVSVVYVDPASPNTVRVSSTGMKRVIVSVARDGMSVASLVALRTSAWDNKSDGSPTEPSASKLLLVVDDEGSLSAEDLEIQALATVWGYDVVVTEDANATLADLDAADVVYVSKRVTQGDLASDIPKTTTGVVIAEDSVYDLFGMANSVLTEKVLDIEIADDTHPIVSGFSLGVQTIHTQNSNLKLIDTTGGYASGATIVAYGPNTQNTIAILAAETGDLLITGRDAAGRRVIAPWAKPENLNLDGQTLLEQMIEWAEGVR